MLGLLIPVYRLLVCDKPKGTEPHGPLSLNGHHRSSALSKSNRLCDCAVYINTSPLQLAVNSSERNKDRGWAMKRLAASLPVTPVNRRNGYDLVRLIRERGTK